MNISFIKVKWATSDQVLNEQNIIAINTPISACLTDCSQVRSSHNENLISLPSWHSNIHLYLYLPLPLYIYIYIYICKCMCSNVYKRACTFG